MMKCFTIQFNSDIAKNSDEIRLSLYANIGFFIEVTQMLKFNLRKLICYHLSVREIETSEFTEDKVLEICKKYDCYYKKTYIAKWTFGRLKKEIKELNIIDEKVLSFFDDVIKFRNVVVHKIFQYNVINKQFEKPDFVNDYVEKRLIPMINDAMKINKMVIKIINLYKEDLHKYKREFNIPFEE